MSLMPLVYQLFYSSVILMTKAMNSSDEEEAPATKSARKTTASRAAVYEQDYEVRLCCINE